MIDTVRLSNIDNIIKRLSVTVNLPLDTPTVLYSGKIGEIHTSAIVQNMENVRIIENTEVGKFLANSDGNFTFQKILEAAIKNEINADSNVTVLKKYITPDNYNKIVTIINSNRSKLEQAIEIAKDGYTFNADNGAWAIASKQFVLATPIESEIICFVPEADLSRTWALVEVLTARTSLPDNQVFGGYTIAQLRAETELKEVYNLLMEESKVVTADIKLFYDINGEIVGSDASFLVGGTPQTIPIDTVFLTTIGDRRQYAAPDDLAKICLEYNNLTDLQKLQIGQLELYGRNHNLTDMHMLFQGGSAGSTGNVRIAFDADGNIMGIDASSLTNGKAMDMSSGSAVFDIASDGSMSVKLQNAPDGSAWWHNKRRVFIGDNHDMIKHNMILYDKHPSRIKMISGAKRESREKLRMSMKEAFEVFFERNNNSWKQVFGTYPQCSKAERFKTCGLFISETDKNNKAEWLPQKQEESRDFTDIEKKIGFTINPQIKEYLTTFWFLPINSSTDTIEQFQLNPILPNIDFESDIIFRFDKEVNHYLDDSEYFLISDFCSINGDDTYTLQVNNTTGNVVAVQVFDKKNIVVANSLIDLLNEMKGEWE